MKVVPNPDYAQAKYEYVLLDKYGREIDTMYTGARVRGNRIENGKIVDLVFPFILQPDPPKE